MFTFLGPPRPIESHPSRTYNSLNQERKNLYVHSHVICRDSWICDTTWWWKTKKMRTEKREKKIKTSLVWLVPWVWDITIRHIIRHIIIIIIVYLTYVYIFLSPLPSPSLSIFSPLFLPLSLFLCVYKKLSWLYITHSMPNATLNVHIPIIMYCKRFVHGDTRIEFRWNIRVGFAHCSCTCTIRRCLYTVRCSKTYVYTMFTRSQRYRYIYTY